MLPPWPRFRIAERSSAAPDVLRCLYQWAWAKKYMRIYYMLRFLIGGGGWRAMLHLSPHPPSTRWPSPKTTVLTMDDKMKMKWWRASHNGLPLVLWFRRLTMGSKPLLKCNIRGLLLPLSSKTCVATTLLLKQWRDTAYWVKVRSTLSAPSPPPP